MRSIFEAITTFLEADEWPLHRIGEDTAYSMTFRGEHGQWTCVAQAYEEERMFIFYSACPVAAPPERRSAVAEFLVHANYELAFGNFEMELPTGDIRFRTSIALPAQELDSILVSQVVYGNVLAMDRYLVGVRAVAEEGKSFEEAYQLVINQVEEE
ncbi:MAG: YbjN domain-containing protein [Candidatus Viridilinea halotolerans]|uniref:YbjN domain-containing protein n=1 Tax=Candidatus Viridilinea halotolerans TaxID=2491704 RepID=A0A426TUZ8_9CHLR|nr:MAG: YbjN domain-containing protein [Candidatus Viridilinea halotolerans]